MPVKKKSARSSKRVKRAATSKRQLTPFRILDLPRELRDHVYTYAIEDTHRSPRDDWLVRLGSTPVIAGTCNQIRTEILPMFYSTKAFEVCIHETCHCWIRNLLSQIGEKHSKMIKSLTVDVHLEDGFSNFFRWGKTREEFLDKDCKIIYTSLIISTEMAFETFNGTMNKLRAAGLDWSQIESILDDSLTLMSCTGWDGTWPISDPSDEDTDFSIAEDSDEDVD